MHRCGLANQATSVSRDDGLQLSGAYVAAVNRCAPPGNRPTPDERDRCVPFLVREIGLLRELRTIVALGAFAWDGVLRALAAGGHPSPTPRPRFGHAAEVSIGPYTLLGCFHPSQQNTFTGKLTPTMLDDVLLRAAEPAA
jgi:uracil-DNA glycosylase